MHDPQCILYKVVLNTSSSRVPKCPPEKVFVIPDIPPIRSRTCNYSRAMAWGPEVRLCWRTKVPCTIEGTSLRTLSERFAYIQLCINTWFSAILASSVRKAPSLFITTDSVLLFVAHNNILWTAQSRITSHPGEWAVTCLSSDILLRMGCMCAMWPCCVMSLKNSAAEGTYYMFDTRCLLVLNW